MRASIVVVSMSGALLLLAAPRPSRACGVPAPPPGDSAPPCSFINLYIPGDHFPAQLERAIRIGTFDKVDGALSPQPTFDPNVQIYVHRLTATGYEPVAFQLVQEAGLVQNALHLQLADPTPGQYLVSSPQMTCAADPAPTGTGLIVGSFQLDPAVPLPTSLGTLDWAGQHNEQQTYSFEDSECALVNVTMQVTHSTLEVQLANDALPWANVLHASIYVDGQLYQGSGPLHSENGVATVDLTRVCSSSDPTNVPTQSGFDGVHTVKIVGHLEGFPDFESTQTQFSLSCGDPGLFGGCAVGGDAQSSLVPLLAASLAFVVRRRKRA